MVCGRVPLNTESLGVVIWAGECLSGVSVFELRWKVLQDSGMTGVPLAQ